MVIPSGECLSYFNANSKQLIKKITITYFSAQKKNIMKILKIKLALFLILAVCSVSTAQIKQAILKTEKVQQFGKAEWDIQLTGEWSNPYLMEDIALDMLLTSPSGKTVTVPCFYQSGESGKLSDWKARFTAQEKGNYSVTFRLAKKGKTIQEYPAAKFESVASGKKGILHPNDTYTFKFDNGELFRGIGENLCWEARSNDDSKYFKTLHENERFNYEFLLNKLATNGGNYTRIWMCPWNFPLEWKTVSPNTNRYTNSDEYYNPSAIRKLDRLFELSDSLGIYIMLTLSGGHSFETGNYSIKTVGFAVNDSDFFVNTKSKEQYKNKLRYLIARWGYSSSIGAWEFFNEVDYLSFGKNPNDNSRQKAVTAWHDEMSTYLKQNDPYGHLVTTSISHRDVEGLNSIKNIDFNQKHIYKNTAGIPSTIVNYTKSYGKPYVIGEFGYEWDWSKDFDQFAENMDSDFKRGLWLGLFSPTPILPMSWWWEYFENRGLMEYFKRVREISDLMMKSGKGSFEPIEVTASQTGITVYSVKCGNQIFIYLFNPTGEAATTSVDLAGNQLPQKMSLFTCETGSYSSSSQFELNGGKLKLMNIDLTAKSDKVVILDLK